MSIETLAVAIWLAEAESRLKFDSAWLFLVTPVTLFALAAVVRAFTAEDRVRQQCADKIVAIKDSAFTADVYPALAEIIVNIYPYFPDEISAVIVERAAYLPGQPGNDPKLEATRILGYRTASFAASLSSLETIYGTVHRAISVHGRLVAHHQRCGTAMGIFFVAWVYFSLFLMLPNFDFPIGTIWAAVIVLSFSIGWAACEWWGGNRENNALSKMAGQARVALAGQAS